MGILPQGVEKNTKMESDSRFCKNVQKWISTPDFTKICKNGFKFQIFHKCKKMESDSGLISLG